MTRVFFSRQLASHRLKSAPKAPQIPLPKAPLAPLAPAPKPLTERVANLNSSKKWVEGKFKSLKKGVGFVGKYVGQAVELGKNFSSLHPSFEKGLLFVEKYVPQIEKESKDLDSNLSFIGGAFPAVQAALDIVALEEGLVGNDKKLKENSIKQLSLGVSIAQNLHETASWAEKWGLVTLSKVSQKHMKDAKSSMKALKSLFDFIEKWQTSSPLSSMGAAFLKLSVSCISFYNNFFKSKSLGLLVDPLSTAASLISNASKLRKNVDKMQKKGISKELLFESCKLSSSMALSVLTFASLGYGQALGIPLMVSACTFINNASEAALYAAYYF